MTPFKIASIGSTLANNGTHISPHLVSRIDAGDSSTVYENELRREKVLDPKHTAIVNQTLTRVFTAGTARHAQVPGHPLAGKTGTTNTDAWMLAYSAVNPSSKVPAYVCSAWAGYPDNRSIHGVAGADVARICQYFLSGALKTAPAVEFAPADLSIGEKVGLG